MFQLKRILLSGLVALSMVGMATATDYGNPSQNLPRISIGGYIGGYYAGGCDDTSEWNCVKLWIIGY